MTDKADQLRQARELFAALGLSNWFEGPQALRSGGQAGVLTVYDTTGRKGVFRCLTQINGSAVARFYREIRVLTNPRFTHRNLVEILEHTNDQKHQWYISRLGHPFKGRWERFRSHHSGDPTAVLTEAVHVIAQLCDGLTSLHDAGIVHRDIKPDNIIVDSPDGAIVPILIDLGIAHVESEERLTASDTAVANKRFSPDVMMNRMEQVTPWLDVFQLSQLLIWMVQVQSAMPHWDRPLDWRFVNYHDRLPDGPILALRAITALCSEERISPKSGGELATLLRERFPLANVERGTATTFDASKIREAIAQGKSIQNLKIAEDHRLIEASATAISDVYRQLREGMEAFTDELREKKVQFQKSTDTSLANFIDAYLSGMNQSNEKTLYELDFGEPLSQKFHFRVNCSLFVPSLKEHANWPPLSESSNLACLYLQRYANQTRVKFPFVTKVVTLERDGTLRLRNEQMLDAAPTTALILLENIKNWITEPEPWQIIQRDR